MDANRLQQIEELYHAAREDRAVLDKADPELRRDVESLLARDGLVGPLEQPPMEVAAKLLADSMVTPLVLGTKLGPYRIEAALGAGGMGEVYRAHDARLNRDVAIKVLPPHLADRPDLQERFEREARAIASLNHPNICTLYDIGHQDGSDYLVMEYLEGETLAQRLTKGSLPLDQVLRYAIEIAGALDKAHRTGITHRDLKPGNIMLTKSGSKLLDFGLAKLKQKSSPAGATLSKFPTAKNDITQQGTILGTLQYMAPEQLESKEADTRTDIFAFGVVVYEMATGKKAFEGKSQASLIAKILETDPPAISSLQPMTPPALDRLVKKCLAKEPEKRWQNTGDLCDELKWITESSSQIPSVLAGPVKDMHWRRPVILGLGASLLGALIASLAIWNGKPAPAPLSRPVSRTVIDLPAGDQLAALDYPAIALSPDGTQLAYVAIRAGTRQIYLRPLASLEARPVAGTEGANTPFFSPDGRWLGFFADSKLKKVSVSGGAAVTLGNLVNPSGASWGSEGMIAFAPDGSAIQQVSDGGGAAQPLTRLENGESRHVWPQFLPGGKAVLFSTTGANPQVAVQSPGSGAPRDLSRLRINLVPGGTSPRYAPSGHLIYIQGGNLMAASFDLLRPQVVGAAVPVVEGILQPSLPGGGQYSISATGSLAYVPGAAKTGEEAERLVWVSRDGAEHALAAPPHVYEFPRFSPDGRRVAVNIEEQETHIWLYDIARETLSRFTFGEPFNQMAAWTPDGKRMAFSSADKVGPANLFWQLADGSGGLERLTTSEDDQFPRSFSPDGQLLVYETKLGIWVLRLSDRKAQPFLRKPSLIAFASTFSPDGHWLAYISDESGRYEVYVQPYPGPGGKWQISTGGGGEPVWNHNGRELFYRSGSKMMAVDITTQPNFSAGKPKTLFEGPYVPKGTLPDYDVSPDGLRFLMIKPLEQTTSLTQIVVVQNWLEELKQKVPVGKQ